MIGGLSRGCSQRLARRVKGRQDLFEMISSLNWMHVGDFDAQPNLPPSPLQLRVLKRLEEFGWAGGRLRSTELHAVAGGSLQGAAPWDGWLL